MPVPSTVDTAEEAAIRVEVSRPRSRTGLLRRLLFLQLLPLLLLLLWLEEGASLRSPGLELSVVVLDVSISSLNEDWVDIFGLDEGAVVVTSEEDNEDNDEADNALLDIARDFDLLVFAVLVLVVLLTASAVTAGEDIWEGGCWCWRWESAFFRLLVDRPGSPAPVLPFAGSAAALILSQTEGRLASSCCCSC
jgi:hypothetical protein